MTTTSEMGAVSAIRDAVHTLRGEPADFDPLLQLVGNAPIVLLGEASHGTHEFYRIRSEITKRLIREKGFCAVAVEADWPDAYRVNRYVRGVSQDADASVALADFARFPQWMWRNADILDFVGWLRQYNDQIRRESARVGFYGLDLYSLHASIQAVLQYLRVVDPEAARRAERRYTCFDHFGSDPQDYGYATTLGLSASCEREVLEQLRELRASAAEYANRDGRVTYDSLFFAEQNARIVAHAEQYYREMFQSRIGSWNLRDRHMAETLNSLVEFLRGETPQPRVVVWAHNSHLGDARATEMGASGELNVGQLVRERWGDSATLVGFTTFTGTVTAARDWGGPAERRTVQPALPGSYEALLHQASAGNLFLNLRQASDAVGLLNTPRLERAIGVIYRPESERSSHYFTARLPGQFDAVFHYDRTRAVEPLERTGLWDGGAAELPETFPSAL